MDEMKELLESFLVETREILETLDQEIMSLETNPDGDTLNAIFRGFHTIKGTAGFMGFENISSLTHEAEDLLNKLRKGELEVTPEIIDALLDVHQVLTEMVEQVATQGNDGGIDYQGLVETFRRLRQQQAEAPAQSESSAETAAVSGDQERVLDKVLSDPQFGKRATDDFTPEEYALLDKAFEEINEEFAKKEQDPSEVSESKESSPTPEEAASASGQAEAASKETVKTTPPAKPKAAPSQSAVSTKKLSASLRGMADNTIRVDVRRLEALMDLSGELVLGRNRLTQITESLVQEFRGHELIKKLQETMAQINFITTELQSAIMKTRMVPIAKLFQRAPRIVRDLAREFGKEIKVVLKGEETELDRSIIEELVDPLVHMIRNSCDHGIESPEERIQAGKPRYGTIWLEAEHQENHIVIRIRDDGRGLNAEKIKQKALEKGLISPEVAAQLGDKEIYNLIFLPGFSTADKVTSVSGRGVGMDVVRTNIEKLKGIIEVDSKPGEGTTFTIKLPLTLAIIQGLLVEVQGEVYTIPLSSVIEVVSTNDYEIYTVNQQEVICIRDDIIQLVRMDQMLNTPTIREDLEDRYVCVVGFAEHRIGLVVDELLGQKEIVIKSLGDFLKQIPGIAGSTILGDGRVILIIDVIELIRNAQRARLLRGSNVAAAS